MVKLLKDFGKRVQYSVFECILENGQKEEMCLRIEKTINPAEDKVRVYALCGACEKTIHIYGSGELVKDEKYYIL